MQEGGRGLGARLDGRRLDRRLPGVSRDPQHRPRTVQGRHPLPPWRHARRGQGPCDVDDVEVRAHGPSFRRSEGWRRVQPEGALARRARADDPSLHQRDHQRHRTRAGHPRARRRHGRPRDGVDLRHVLDEQGPLGARCRHRQAAVRRRLPGSRGGDRSRSALLHPRAREQAGTAPERVFRGGSGIRERRFQPRAPASPGGGEGGRGLGLDAAASTTRTVWTSHRPSHTSKSTEPSKGSRRRRRSRTTSSSSSPATSSPPARSSRSSPR